MDVDEAALGDAHRSPTPVALLDRTPRGAVRRTTTMEACADGDWRKGQVVTARGRDLAVDLTGAPRVLGTAALECRVDGRGVVRASHDAVHDPLPEWLLGAPARHGLRRRMADAHPDPARLAQLDLVLLDDLPGIQIISGYAQLHDVLAGGERVVSGHSMVGTCAGFAAGGQAATRGGHLPDMISGRPIAPVGTFPDDPRTWQPEPPATLGGMQRRRLVQVQPTDGGRTAVLAWFRDVFTAPDGAQTIVHEYGLEATVAQRSHCLVVEHLQARPRALPLPDCQDAVGHVVQLSDTDLVDIDTVVRRTLAGSAGCTHLNDLLRALRAVPYLIERLPAGNPLPTTATRRRPHRERD